MYEKCYNESCVFCFNNNEITKNERYGNKQYGNEDITEIVSFSSIKNIENKSKKLFMNEIQIREFANILSYESQMHSSVADNLVNFSSCSPVEKQYFEGIATGFEMAKKELEKYISTNLD